MRTWVTLALLVLVAGCAGGALRLGDRAVDRGEYEVARTHFEKALQDSPNDYRAERGLGQVFYKLGQYDEAIDHLRAARAIRPEDGLTALYLGLSLERKDDPGGAAAVYEDYLSRVPQSKFARQLHGRLLYVRNEDMRQQAKQAIALESGLVRDTTGPVTIAVLPLALTGESADSLTPLSRGLAAAISYDLFQIKSIRVVERLRLDCILRELALVDSGFTVKKSSPRLGRILGADKLVSGNLEFLGAGDVSVQSGIVETDAGTYQLAMLSEDQYTRVWRLQKAMTFAIIDSLGLKLTPAERNAIEKIPTEKFPAFLAYSQGIDHLDRGDYEAANHDFAQAAKIDGGFTQAGELKDESALLMEGSVPIADFESEAAAEVSTGTEFGDASEALFDVAPPQTDPRTDDAPAVESGTVTVGGSIP